MRAGESGSATFGGRRHVLDRNVLRMRLVQADVLVVAMMPIMLVMGAHPGIGVQYLRLALGLDDRCLCDLVHGRLCGLARRTGKHRRGENGNGNERCGNGLEHGCLLWLYCPLGPAGISGRKAGLADHAGDASGFALNPS